MIYKKHDIDRAFTEAVTGLIAQGYQINPATMDGSQGEIAHVDLYKGDEILRVLLSRGIERAREGSCGYRELSYLSLTVGRCTDPIRNDRLETSETVWNNHLEILSEIKFASLTPSPCDARVYFDMVSGQEARNKQARRWKVQQSRCPFHRELSDEYKPIALRWLRKQKGFKTCRLNEIESVVRVNKRKWDCERGCSFALPSLLCYEIKARGKKFTLRP